MTVIKIKASELQPGDVMVEAPGAADFRRAFKSAETWEDVEQVKAEATADQQRDNWPTGKVAQVFMPIEATAFPRNESVTIVREVGTSNIVMPADGAVYVDRG